LLEGAFNERGVVVSLLVLRAIQPNITNIFDGVIHLDMKARSIMKIWEGDGKKNLFVSTEFEEIYCCKV